MAIRLPRSQPSKKVRIEIQLTAYTVQSANYGVTASQQQAKQIAHINITFFFFSLSLFFQGSVVEAATKCGAADLSRAGGVITLDCSSSSSLLHVNRDRRSTCRWENKINKKQKKRKLKTHQLERLSLLRFPQSSRAPLKGQPEIWMTGPESFTHNFFFFLVFAIDFGAIRSLKGLKWNSN